MRGRKLPHSKGLAYVMDAIRRSDHSQLMVNNDHQMLYLNTADYKPAVKCGQVEPIILRGTADIRLLIGRRGILL